MQKVRMLTRIACHARCATGIQHITEAKRQRSFVLIYHGFAERRPRTSPDRYTIDISTFRRHLNHVARTHRPVLIDKVVAALRQGLPLRDPMFCVVLDDALISQVKFALPLCREIGVPVTVAVPVGCVGSGRPIWTTELAVLVLAWKDSEIPLPGLATFAPARTSRDRVAALKETRKHLGLEPDPEKILAHIDFLRAQVESDRYERLLAQFYHLTVADWKTLESCIGEDVTFVAHGWSHVALNEDWAERTWSRETVDPAHALEQQLGVKACGFALPNGIETADTAQRMEDAGYSFCMGSRRGFLDLQTDLWSIPRIDAEYSLSVLRRHLTR